MDNAKPLVILLIVAAFASACQSNGTQNPPEPRTDRANPTEPADKPAAYLDGKVVTQAQLYRLIIQAHGGDALAEILLDRAVRDRLTQESIQLTEADIQAERDKLLASLDPDPDQAARLLRTMRDQRGLDATRFTAMLKRNAGLRRLVRDQVTVNDAALQQAYQLRYGNRYRVRLIVTDKLDTLTQARRQTLAGQSFTELAIKLSTDTSASQGGLLSPISPADATYPKAIRDALSKLKMDTPQSRLSPAIALDSGYALLWLEEIVATENPPKLDAVRSELERVVRSDLERLRMRQLAQTFIDQADVVVLDPALNKAWQRQKKAIDKP